MRVQKHSAEQNISIHAPAKERLRKARSRRGTTSYFNPRSCEGATLMTFDHRIHLLKFQSTLLRRSDAYDNEYMGEANDFNPRSCEGATIVAK